MKFSCQEQLCNNYEVYQKASLQESAFIALYPGRHKPICCNKVVEHAKHPENAHMLRTHIT